MDAAEIGQVLVRIQTAFLEHPGLPLTLADVEHLCSVPAEACEALLGVLVDAGVVRRLPDGSLVHSAGTEAVAGRPCTAAEPARPFSRLAFGSLASLVRERVFWQAGLPWMRN